MPVTGIFRFGDAATRFARGHKWVTFGVFSAAMLAPPASTVQTFRNARIVTPDDVIGGDVVVEDGCIASVGPTAGAPAGAVVDFAGDYLLPGFVDIHTDNVERHIRPRPGVWWPAGPAIAAHDAQIAGAGITTVLNALAVGAYQGRGDRPRVLAEAVAALDFALAAGSLRADHYLHLRLEVSDPAVVELFEPVAEHPRVRMASLMDHTPGQRQWRDLARYKAFRMGRLELNEDEYEADVATKLREQEVYADRHREQIVELVGGLEVRLASHDDTTREHVVDAAALGATISEFPTTPEAADEARSRGLRTVMGAPNVVRGGSHSGNASALALAGAGLLDALASDYVPSSLCLAALRLADEIGITLPRAIAMISLVPAQLAGFADRGAIAPGLRADMVRMDIVGGVPAVKAVWRSGERVF